MASLQLFVLVVGIVYCIAAPIPYADSLRKLDELKGRLEELERTLRDFNSAFGRRNIGDAADRVYRNLSPEDQALIDKHKSKLNFIDATLSRDGEIPEDEDAEIPDTQEEKRQLKLDQVYRSLSPEDQALLDKHKSMQSKIDASFMKENNPPEDEDPEIEAETEEERRGSRLEEVYRSLSPEDQALLDKHKSKQSKIDATLLKHGSDASSEDPEIVDLDEDTNDMERRGTFGIENYISQLSKENQQLLKRMQSKLPYLQHALEKKTSIKEETLSLREQSPEDMDYLLNDENPDEQLAKFEESLSPEDLALLKTLKSKLHYLKMAVVAKHPSSLDEDDASQSEAEGGADAGPLEERREAKMDGWNEQPMVDSDLGAKESDLKERCACDKPGLTGRCACDKHLHERCPGCQQNEVLIKLLEERCPTCQGNKTPDRVFEEVEGRLLKDLAFAEENGISIPRLIRGLQAKQEAEKLSNEERELKLLGNM